MKAWKQDGGAPVKAWIDGVPVEEAALDQINTLAQLPFVFKHIAVMPDVHYGKGSTVGTVVATRDAIVPAACGVDIGCGMMAMRTSLTQDDLGSLSELRDRIERVVPHGRTNDGRPGDKGAWADVPGKIADTWRHDLGPEFARLCERHPKLASANTVTHLGTLGTGNHFVEVCVDTEGLVWVMLHSGSRGVGGRIGSYFTDLARKEIDRWFVTLPGSPKPNRDLAYLPRGTSYFDDYIDAVNWAARFAEFNRSFMLDAVSGVLCGKPWLRRGEVIECAHNYVTTEHHFGANVLVTRKGAVRAREGDLGIIPGSMGARSFIVRGKGNRDSFCSCSHGAGRAMSRTEAARRFTVADHEAATAGVECRKDAAVIDETPAAYKSIDAVMAAQTDLVEVVHELRQIVCVKG